MKTPYFSGMVYHGSYASHFTFKYCGYKMPACNNNYEIAAQIDESLFSQCQEFAWGYEGTATTRLAMDMLTIYAGYDASWSHNAGRVISDGTRYDLPKLRCPALPISFIKEHYKAFASEVVANLTDDWKLTFKQIDRWINKQTKGKTNERKSTKTKGG